MERSNRIVLAALSGVFVSLLPVLMLVAALSRIARDLSTTEATLAWAITAPLVTGSVLLPTAGRLGDLHGHRRVFLVAMGAAAVCAALVATAWDAPSLIVFRTLGQASGVAASPSAIALAVSSRPESERTQVLGLWAASTAFAPATGLLVGGPAVDALSWRGVFVVQAALAVAVVVFASRVLPETPRAARVSFDLPGAAAFMAMSGALVWGLDRAGRWGWGHPVVAVSFAASVLAGWTFDRVERRAQDPMLAPALLRNGRYLASGATELLVQVATNGALFVLPLALVDRYGSSVGRISLYMAGLPVGMALVAPLSGRVAGRISERAASVVGTAALAAPLGVMAWSVEHGPLGLTVAMWFLAGVANGVVRPAIAAAGAAALEPAAYGAGMAAIRMASTAGASAGITLTVGLMPLGGFASAFAACAVASALGVLTSVPLRQRDGPGTAVAPPR